MVSKCLTQHTGRATYRVTLVAGISSCYHRPGVGRLHEGRADCVGRKQLHILRDDIRPPLEQRRYIDGNVAEKVARSMYPSCSIDQSLTWQLTCATFEPLIVTEKLGVSKIRTTLNLEGHRIPEYFVFDRVAALLRKLLFIIY